MSNSIFTLFKKNGFSERERVHYMMYRNSLYGKQLWKEAAGKMYWPLKAMMAIVVYPGQIILYTIIALMAYVFSGGSIPLNILSC